MKVLRFILKGPAWCVVTGFFAILLAVVIVGGNVAGSYSSTINGMLGIRPYQPVGVEDFDYFTSDYLKTEGEKEVFDHKAMRASSMEIAEQVASEGAVLLWNEDGALPLAPESRVSLFGIGSVNYKFSGGGSGEIVSSPGNNLRVELETAVSAGGPGLRVNGSLFNAYGNTLRRNYGTSNAQGSATKSSDFNGSKGYLDERYREFYVNEVPWSTLNNAVSGGIEATLEDGRNSRGYGDAAIMVITRDGAEDGDTGFFSQECLDNNYLDLSTEEADILSHLQALKQKGTIKRIVLLMNTACVMQMKHIKEYDIDACVLLGAGGITSFKAIANVLSGKINPSGHLVDTIAYDVYSAPANENFGHYTWTENRTGLPTNIQVYNNSYLVYQEGIYVGYKYYETRYEDSVIGGRNANGTAGVKAGQNGWKYGDEVAYPFGYGLSYTTFEYVGFKVSHKSGKYGGTYNVSVSVKNSGEVAGKTAVGVYLQKPYTPYDEQNGVEKASVELVAFAKTDVIPAGKTVEVALEVNGSEFKTYDSYGQGTYILEAGDYYLTAASDSHEAVNNVLAAKGYTVANGMDKAGNSALTAKFTVGANDFDTYSKSEWSDYKIENQLSDGDINLYSGTANQKITYLSRKNWQGTYPSPVKLTCTNDIMVYDMQYGHGDINADGVEMPATSTVTADKEYLELLDQESLMLANLMDSDFDDPLWENLLDQMSFVEMEVMMSGGYLNLLGAVSVGAPGGVAADGSSGVRINNPEVGTQMGLPTETVMAQTWDTELIYKLGVAFGHECLHAGCDQIYAPVANMHRSAFGGRNWESYSEDSFISGKMLVAEVRGMQKEGIIVCAKHFAFNDQEINRCGVATFMNEQTAREIYLKPFELGVNEGEVMSLMASFPRLGCRWVGNYSGLFTEILRREWNFKGFVETDSAFGQYYMTHYKARAEGVVAGVDFWMSGGHTDVYGLGTPADGRYMWELYQNNAVVVRAMRESCKRIMYAQLHSAAMNGIGAKTKIIYVTPWWQEAILKAQIAVGVVLGVCVAITIGAFVFTFLDKKKRKSAAESAVGATGQTVEPEPSKDERTPQTESNQTEQSENN